MKSINDLKLRICKCLTMSACGIHCSSVDYANLFGGTEMVARSLGFENSARHRAWNRHIACFVRFDRYHQWFGPCIFVLTYLLVLVCLAELTAHCKTTLRVIREQDNHHGDPKMTSLLWIIFGWKWSQSRRR